jgi:hypothetical protein
MFNTTEISISDFVERLRLGYRRTYGGGKPAYEDLIAWAGRLALEQIARSDALYHDVEHTVLVTLVGQEMLRGKQLWDGSVTCEDWLNFVISLVCHDVGYVKGVCRDDGEGCYASGQEGAQVALPPGATDAALTPYHVDRGKLFVAEQFGGHPQINVAAIQGNLELTRFPVPGAADPENVPPYANLLRAADLIGQLSDPHYLKKIAALFYEFEETGQNQRLGYRHPADLRRNYPQFYWTRVHPHVQDGLHYLSLTPEGRQIIANLYANVFMVEYEEMLVLH